MEVTLSQLQPGKSGVVSRVSGERVFRRRLQEMGIVRGNRVGVVEVAPFGDPIKLRVPSYDLSIRRRDADLVTVVPEE